MASSSPLAQNVCFAVSADGPCDCLALVALELNESRVVQERTPNRGVRISRRYAGEIALHHVVSDDTREDVDIGGDVRRRTVDCKRV